MRPLYRGVPLHYASVKIIYMTVLHSINCRDNLPKPARPYQRGGHADWQYSFLRCHLCLQQRLRTAGRAVQNLPAGRTVERPGTDLHR